jgi:hypothetical protein
METERDDDVMCCADVKLSGDVVLEETYRLSIRQIAGLNIHHCKILLAFIRLLNLFNEALSIRMEYIA